METLTYKLSCEEFNMRTFQQWCESWQEREKERLEKLKTAAEQGNQAAIKALEARQKLKGELKVDFEKQWRDANK